MITLQKLSVLFDALELSHQHIEFLQALVDGQNQQIEYLQALVEGQNQEIRVQEEQIQELQQELELTNADLCKALNQQEVYLAEAEQFAQTNLSREKLQGQDLAKSLNIYGSLSIPEELEPPSRSIFEITPSANSTDKSVTYFSQLKDYSKQLKIQFDELRSNLIKFQTQYQTTQECSKNLITQARETKKLSKTLRSPHLC